MTSRPARPTQKYSRQNEFSANRRSQPLGRRASSSDQRRNARASATHRLGLWTHDAIGMQRADFQRREHLLGHQPPAVAERFHDAPHGAHADRRLGDAVDRRCRRLADFAKKVAGRIRPPVAVAELRQVDDDRGRGFGGQTGAEFGLRQAGKELDRRSFDAGL